MLEQTFSHCGSSDGQTIKKMKNGTRMEMPPQKQLSRFQSFARIWSCCPSRLARATLRFPLQKIFAQKLSRSLDKIWSSRVIFPLSILKLVSSRTSSIFLSSVLSATRKKFLLNFFRIFLRASSLICPKLISHRIWIQMLSNTRFQLIICSNSFLISCLLKSPKLSFLFTMISLMTSTSGIR